MTNTSRLSKRVLYSLLGLQVILAFVLGVLGSKVAELFNTSSKLVLVTTIVIMMLSFIVTIAISRHENRVETRNQLPLFPAPSSSERISRILLNRIVTIFPLGVVIGALISFLSVEIMPRMSRWTVINLFYYSLIHSYEVIIFIVALITLIMISRRRRNISLVLSYALGFAASITGVLIMLRPNENSFSYTFFGWSIVLAFFGLIMRSNTTDVLYNDLSALIKNLVRDRSDQ